MAEVIIIAGFTGSGKTYSLRNLDPDNVFYIDSDKKGAMPWGGWKKSYQSGKNYIHTSNCGTIYKSLIARCIKNGPKKIGAEFWKTDEDLEKANAAYNPNIKVVVIDTINGIMNDIEMVEIAKAKKAGGDSRAKWNDFATDIYALQNFCKSELPKEITVIMFAHPCLKEDSNGVTRTEILTNGRKLEKINPASWVNLALLGKCRTHIDENGPKSEYYFETQNNNSFAKSPAGLFPFEIPNDLDWILKEYERYQNE